MWIKGSGLRLCDISPENGLAQVDNAQLLEGLSSTAWAGMDRRARESAAQELVQSASSGAVRPSIETVMHALLGEFVLHTHPTAVNAAFNNRSAAQRAADWLPDCTYVEYHTPGIDLALAVGQRSQQDDPPQSPRTFLLGNHGLLVSADSAQAAFDETERVCDLLNERLGLGAAAEKICNQISGYLEALTGEDRVTIHTEDTLPWPEELRPFFPDAVVFLGAGPLVTESPHLESSVRNYFSEHGIPPRMLRVDGRNYFSGSSYARARDGAEVWQLHALAARFGPEALPPEEVRYLSNWEAEKYRQRM